MALLTIARLVANGAFRFLYPFLPVVARSLGVTEARAGILVSALALGGIATPLTRQWLTGGGERPRRLAVAGTLVMAAGGVVAAGAPGLAVGLLGWVVLGTGKPLLDVAAITYVSERVPLSRRARATSAMELTWAGGLVLVAPVAGVLAALTSWRLPLALLAGAAVVTAAALASRLDADPERGHARTEADRLAADRDPSVAASDDGARRPFLVLGAMLYVALEATFAVSGLWAERAFGASVQELGGFVAVAAGGELLGSLVMTLWGDRLGKARMVVVGLVVCAAGLLSLPFATSITWAAVGLAVALFGSETAIVASIPLASEVVPHARSRFLASMVSVGSVSRAGAAAVGPALLVTFGIGANVAVSVSAALVAVVLLRHVVARHPRLGA